MELTSKQRRWLRGQAHGLEALVQGGKGGLSEGLINQTIEALARHELIKVRFVADRPERGEQALALAAATGAEVAGSIGRVAILYRAMDDAAKRRYRFPANTNR